MKKILTILLLIAGYGYADPYTRVFVDTIQDTNEVVSIKRNITLAPQTPFKPNEVARKPYNYSLPRDFIGIFTNEFDEIENQYSDVPQKYWKWDGNDIVAMTTQERADRDTLLSDIDLARRTRDPLEKALQDKIKTLVSSKFSINPPYSEQDIKNIVANILQEMNQARIDWSAATTLPELRTANESYMEANSLFGSVVTYLLMDEILTDQDMKDAGFGGDHNP